MSESVIEKMLALAEQMQELSTKIAVAEIGDHVKKQEITDVIRFQDNLKRLSDTISAARAEGNKTYDHIRINVLPELMEDKEMDSLTVTGVGRVNIGADVYASVIKGKKDDALDWLQENDMADIISETINSGSLKALARQRIKAGEPLPDDLFKVTPYSVAKITRK